jgi:hypothetical protein
VWISGDNALEYYVKCPKWEKTRLTLNNTRKVIDVEGASATLDCHGWRPINNKKAKAERNGATLPASMGVSIDMLIVEVVSNSKDRDDERDKKND